MSEEEKLAALVGMIKNPYMVINGKAVPIIVNAPPAAISTPAKEPTA